MSAVNEPSPVIGVQPVRCRIIRWEGRPQAIVNRVRTAAEDV